MLEALRKSASGILAKILIGLLVLSFAVWGIADVITGVSRTSIASVGEKEISVYEFRRRYQDQVDAVSARFGRRLTPQQARAFGVEGQVLSTMIGALAVDTHAEELNLAVTDKVVETDVRKDDLFKGADGNFDPRRLSNLLSQVGYSESQFLASRRSDLLREQLTSAMLENVTVPKSLLKVFETYQNEQRKISYFTINPKVAVRLKTPTDETLRALYDGNKSRFMTDEMREVEIVMLTAADAKKRIKVADADLKKRFERDKDRYSVPEQRKILQIPFKDKAAAEQARKAIIGGKAFAKVAKESGAKESDINLGLITKSRMIDSKIADAAFGLKKDEVSQVVEGRFTTVLLKVSEIQPGKVPSFDDVKAQVRDSITSAQAADEIRTLHDQVDDNRLAGKSLKEISDLLGLTLRQLKSVSRAGKGPDGNDAFQSPDRSKILDNAFDSSVGEENEVIELADGGYAWVRVLGVKKSEQKTFETVRTEVSDLWKSNETKATLTKLAQDYVKQLQDKKKIADVAKAAGGEVKETQAFKRADSLPDIAPAAINRAFALPKGAAASAATTDGKSRIVFVVTDVMEPAKPDAAAAQQLVEQIAGQLRTDTVAQYVLALRNRLEVETNQALIDQTVGIIREQN